MKLNKQQMKEIAKAGSIYTTGGGISSKGQIKIFDKLDDNVIVEIKDGEDFNSDDYVIRIGGIGPSTDGENELADIKKMVEVLEKITGKKIVGIYPPEIGQEAFVIPGAINAGLPLINFDPAGIRAKPCVDISVFELLKMDYSLSPLVISTSEGEIISVHTKLPSKRNEEILRNTTRISKGNSIFHASGLVSVGDLIKNKVLNKPYNLLEKISKMNFDEFIKHEPVKEVFDAKITKTWEKDLNGFMIKHAEFTANDKKYRLILQNEVMLLLDDKDNVVYSVPDRICLVDDKNMEGVWIGDLKDGLKLKVVILEPEKIWKDNLKRANEIFGYERFKHLI